MTTSEASRPNFPTIDWLSYLDSASRLDVVIAYKQQALDLLEARPGDRVLDVGCGLGAETLTLAGSVGAAGCAIGLDHESGLIHEAHRRATTDPRRPLYLQGDASRLPFGSATFDACRADRVLHTLKDCQTILSEMIRVLRPGGRLVISEPDWDSLIIDSPYRSLTRKIVHFQCDAIGNGWMGRQLPRLFHEAGLNSIATIGVPGLLHNFTDADLFLHLSQAAAGAVQAGIIEWIEGLGWLEALKAASQKGEFFCEMTGFVVRGTKPDSTNNESFKPF